MSCRRAVWIFVFTLVIAGLGFLRAGRLGAQQESVVVGTQFGDPVRGITAREFELFRLGLEDFTEVENPDEGLGPVFNGRSCAECHSIPRIGGSSTITEVRAGIRKDDGSFEEYPGGSVMQMFSIPPHETQVTIPPEINVIARRKSLALFGNGLVEAIPDAVLIALEDPEDRDSDGISGRAHRVHDKAADKTRIGRFGWKAQQATLLAFGAEAYRDEMGITNDLFPDEACPGGDCEKINFFNPVPGLQDALDPNIGLRGIDNFENFMKLLGPPPRAPVTDQALEGERLFQAIGCTACHTPALVTGESPVRALSSKRFFPYSDFLLHDVGTGDGIGQGDARPEEIRTPPLWGVRLRAPFLHDGRASTLREAIELHLGESARSRRQFGGLSETEQAALLAFLLSL
ncbi:MAG TPA: di-heme oxidoredictase family protein [Terriglobia bacterium]|nr:di-heme oxidoredictase family protein [Terriglobia bacterium]